MSYLDGFVIAVPDNNKAKFVDHAVHFDQLFIDAGAIRVVECWEDDVSEGKITDFRKAVQAKPSERVVFSWVEWPDKATRDQGMKAMEDRMAEDSAFDIEKNPMPFDGMRMIYGGFSTIVDLK